MKLNNKGFTISTVMYMILIMAVILITLTLTLLSSRKLILDKSIEEAKDNIYNFVRLPIEYQEVEYIESTGTQYIDTGYQPNNNTNIVYDFEFISGDSNSYIPILGEITSDKINMFAIWIHQNDKKVAINYESVDTKSLTGTNGLGRHLYKNIGNKFYMDGNLIKEISISEFQSSYNLFLLALNEGTSYDTRGSKGRIYSLKIYEGNSLVRNFIPCYRKSDGEIGLYDLVNDVFYFDASGGSTSFKVGPDI